jgi:hypothetical protein
MDLETPLSEASSLHRPLPPFQRIRCYITSAVGTPYLNNHTSDKQIIVLFLHTLLSECMEKVIGYA